MSSSVHRLASTVDSFEIGKPSHLTPQQNLFHLFVDCCCPVLQLKVREAEG